jgi:hypothetical protein
MTWEEYLARVAATRGCAEICGRIGDLPPDWAQQLRAVLRQAGREVGAEREAEAELEI